MFLAVKYVSWPEFTSLGLSWKQIFQINNCYSDNDAITYIIIVRVITWMSDRRREYLKIHRYRISFKNGYLNIFLFIWLFTCSHIIYFLKSFSRHKILLFIIFSNKNNLFLQSFEIGDTYRKIQTNKHLEYIKWLFSIKENNRQWNVV